MTTVAMIHGRDHLFFKEQGGWSSPPLVLINHLACMDLCSQERHICLILLNRRYSLAMALMDLGELAQEFGKSVRQVQRWIKKLREKQLIKVTARPGRPSIIDVSPLVMAVKRLVGWQEAEQPTVETLVEVVAEPEPDLSWLPDDTPEEEIVEESLAGEMWEDIRAELSYHLQRWQGPFLGESTAVGIKDNVLIVSSPHAPSGDCQRIADLLIKERWDAIGVKFVPVKKPAKLGLLGRLAVATVGV